MDLQSVKRANELRLKFEQLLEHIKAVQSHKVKLIVPLDENKQLELVMSPDFKQRIHDQVIEQLNQQAIDLQRQLHELGVEA